jgi:hypothetical protein
LRAARIGHCFHLRHAQLQATVHDG